jgi:GTPase Era involved in 16S rRNA processing
MLNNTSPLSLLLTKAEASLPDPTPTQRELLAKLEGVQTRIEEGRLRVAVLGQFKRGKSTLLNALLGTPLLPTGITPVTAIPTFIRAANSPSIRVEFDDAREPFHSRDEFDFPNILGRYVSEAENPANRAKVRRVEIAVNSTSLSDSVILVDTPGVGSTFVHNTRTAEAVLTDCDVGVFVVSADPPITEVELGYLDSVRSLIPKIFFVLNKVDLLDDEERPVAKAFLAKVLAENLGSQTPERIFAVSAKQGLLAKQSRDASALAASGLAELEQALARDLANEKRAIVFAAGRTRAISLAAELLYHSELEHKALLMPEQDLKHKIADFEQSVSRFEAERQNLSDYISVDRRRLLTEINEMTDQVWNEARARFTDIAALETRGPFDERQAREHIGKALEQYFEAASRQTTDKARTELVARLASHQSKATALISHVRQTAADLMEISAELPPPDQAFELGREPYWVAPAPANSILDASALAFVHMMPRGMREKRLRRHIAADTERAALRNVGNLDWALRQNVENAFRRFEDSFSRQLSQALEETRQAMQVALQKRSARSAEVGALVAQSEHSTAVLTSVVNDLKVAHAF